MHESWSFRQAFVFLCDSFHVMYAGIIRWQQPQPPGLHSTAPVLSVPDLDEDMVGDLALVVSDSTEVNMAANLFHVRKNCKWLHLNISSQVQTQLVLLSGRTGVQLGSKVVLNTETANHILHHSTTRSYYILLQTGLCPKTLHDDQKQFRLRNYTKYCKCLKQKCIKFYKTYIHFTWNYKDRLGYLDAHARMLFVPDTSASASSQKPACTDWLCGGSLLKPNQGWRWTSKGTNSGRRMPTKHLGLYQSMSKTQPWSIHREHVFLHRCSFQ